MPVMDQKSSFQDRIKRINAGRQFEHADVIGFRTQKQFERRLAPKLRRPRRTFGQRIMVLVAFFSGILAVVLGRMAYFHLSNMNGMPEALVNLGGRGMFLSVMIVAGTLTVLFGLSTRGRLQALALGCVMMHFGEGAVAASAPDLWAQMFSPDYAAELMSRSPNLAALVAAG